MRHDINDKYVCSYEAQAALSGHTGPLQIHSHCSRGQDVCRYSDTFLQQLNFYCSVLYSVRLCSAMFCLYGVLNIVLSSTMISFYMLLSSFSQQKNHRISLVRLDFVYFGLTAV